MRFAVQWLTHDDIDFSSDLCVRAVLSDRAAIRETNRNADGRKDQFSGHLVVGSVESAAIEDDIWIAMF